MLLCKSPRLLVILSDQAECSVSVMVFKSFRQHILRTCQENPFSVQLEEVRAFPHFSETVIICHKHTFKLPLKSVRTGIQQDLPASVCRTVPDNTAVCAVFLLPHLRIPEVMDTASFRDICFIQYRIHLILLIIHSVTHGKTLRLYITDASVCLPFPQHAGIHQQVSAVRERYRAPGKASVSVISLIRCQSCRKIFPVQKIFAYCMPPVHRSPFRLIRIILVKHVILSVVIRESVRVVHPAGPHRQMKIRAFLLLYHFLRCLFVFSCFTQCLTCHIGLIPFLLNFLPQPQKIPLPFPQGTPGSCRNISA